MAKLACRRRRGEVGFAKAGDGGCLSRIEDLIQVRRRSLRVEAAVAGELEPQMFFADPDLAAILAREVVPLVQVVRPAAGVALRDHVRSEFFPADGA